MRAALALVSLLLVLAVVGVLAKKQLAATHSAVPVLQPGPGALEAAGAAGAGAAASAAPGVRAQGRQVPQQYQQAVEGLMQPRALPEDAQ